MFKRPSRFAVFVIALVAFGVGAAVSMALYTNIVTRKMEAQRTFVQIVAIDETTIDAAEWGKNFPREYDGYIRTSDNARGFGGARGVPRRTKTSQLRSWRATHS